MGQLEDAWREEGVYHFGAARHEERFLTFIEEFDSRGCVTMPHFRVGGPQRPKSIPVPFGERIPLLQPLGRMEGGNKHLKSPARHLRSTTGRLSSFSPRHLNKAANRTTVTFSVWPSGVSVGVSVLRGHIQGLVVGV